MQQIFARKLAINTEKLPFNFAHIDLWARLNKIDMLLFGFEAIKI